MVRASADNVVSVGLGSPRTLRSPSISAPVCLSATTARDWSSGTRWRASSMGVMLSALAHRVVVCVDEHVAGARGEACERIPVGLRGEALLYCLLGDPMLAPMALQGWPARRAWSTKCPINESPTSPRCSETVIAVDSWSSGSSVARRTAVIKSSRRTFDSCAGVCGSRSCVNSRLTLELRQLWVDVRWGPVGDGGRPSRRRWTARSATADGPVGGGDGPVGGWRGPLSGKVGRTAIAFTGCENDRQRTGAEGRT